MICLGNATEMGFLLVAREALRAAGEHGEAAIFIGANGVAAAVAHYESGYRQALESHAAFLAGVYRYEGRTWVRDNARRAALDLKQAYRSIRHARQPISSPGQQAGESDPTHARANAAAGAEDQVRQARDFRERECHGGPVGREESTAVLAVPERSRAGQAGRIALLAHVGAA
jgi:hypothetical protein